MNIASDAAPTDWKEARRLRAWELVQQGWKQQDVATALGVTGGAVSQWVSKARQGGIPALRHHKPPGGPSKLSDQQSGANSLSCWPGARGLRVLRGGLDAGAGGPGY